MTVYYSPHTVKKMTGKKREDDWKKLYLQLDTTTLIKYTLFFHVSNWTLLEHQLELGSMMKTVAFFFFFGNKHPRMVMQKRMMLWGCLSLGAWHQGKEIFNESLSASIKRVENWVMAGSFSHDQKICPNPVKMVQWPQNQAFDMAIPDYCPKPLWTLVEWAWV